MPEDNDLTSTSGTVATPPVPADDSATQSPDQEASSAATDDHPTSNIPQDVVNKIGEAHNILVALSSDPSVDEMSAAIGLSLFLDKLGKRATAIYSGATPNALEFLKPEEAFEPSVDTLQDFVIALNKEKADHLRYKLDGDFVKIYITPYRTRISEEDLEFSYGDFNVDLVLALDVANGIDLDSALREHGRIMHDAVIINITTGNPGKLGEIEWSDKSASSVSEMIAKLLYGMNSKAKIEKEEATAFLTGIVAATNRFSNAKTTSEAMKLASRLMESGANQQLISKNITPDIDNELFSFTSSQAKEEDPTKLDIGHGKEEVTDEDKEVDTVVTEKESTLLDDLKAAEASLAQAGTETTPEAGSKLLKIDSDGNPEEDTKVEEGTEPSGILTPDVKPEANPDEASSQEGFIKDHPEKVLRPTNAAEEPEIITDENVNKYGQMLEDALAGVGSSTSSTETPEAPEAPETPEVPQENPAATNAPDVPTNPEINGVPEINYMPMPGEEVLPPPPAPPIDMDGMTSSEPTTSLPEVNPTTPTSFDSNPITPATPPTTPTPDPLGPQPAMQDQVYAPQVADPSAFKIPGM